MRARWLKPGFFKNEDLVGMPRDVRLVFAATWLVADREGRFEDRPQRIRLDAFPNDHDLDIDGALAMLAARGFLQRYVVGGVAYVQITAWPKHQHPHRREAASTIPPPPATRPTEETDGKPRRHLTVAGTAKDMPRHDLGQAKDMPRTGQGRDEPGGLRITDYGLLKKSSRSIAGATDPTTTCENNVQGSKPSTATAPAEQEPPRPTVDEVVELWHEVMPDCARVRILSTARRTTINARIRHDLQSLDSWRRYFAYIRTRPFLMGKVPPSNGHSRAFKPTLLWFCKAENFAKISEDFYA